MTGAAPGGDPLISILAELRRFRQELRPPRPTEPVYWTLLAVPAALAVLWALPVRVFPSADIYDFMENLASEKAWAFVTGAVALFCGTCGLLHSPAARRTGLAVLGWWHCAIAVSLWLAVPTNIASVAFMVLAVLCGIAFRRPW